MSGLSEPCKALHHCGSYWTSMAPQSDAPSLPSPTEAYHTTLCRHQTTKLGRTPFAWLCTLHSNFDPQNIKILWVWDTSVKLQMLPVRGTPWPTVTSVCMILDQLMCFYTREHRVAEIWKQIGRFVVGIRSLDISRRNEVLHFPVWGLGRKGKSQEKGTSMLSDF